MSTSDALQLARAVDKEGVRTIGVITKIDIMDKGSDALKMVKGEDIPLKLGYVGVKNRSQHDIKTSVKVNTALIEEDKFFKAHPVYSQMPQSYFGTKSLIHKLMNIFYEKVKEYFPEIIKEINGKVRDCELRLKEMGPILPSEPRERMHHLWKMITEFSDSYKNCIKGKFEGGTNIEMAGGAIIRDKFYKLYQDFLGDFRAADKYSDDQIEEAINLHQGDSIPGFPSIDSFIFLIQPNLEELKGPAIHCLDDVFDYLEEIITRLVEKKFKKLPQVCDEIQEISCQTLQKVKNVKRKRKKPKKLLKISLMLNQVTYLLTISSIQLIGPIFSQFITLQECREIKK